MSTTMAGQPEDGALEDVPRFQPVTAAPDDDPLPEGVTHLEDLAPDDDPSTQTSPARPTTRTQPPPPDAGATRPTSPPGPSTSSRTSIDPGEVGDRIDEALAGLTGGAFQLLGVGANKVAQRRHPGTRLWIPTEDEVQTLGDALGRIAGRRVPEELLDDDAGDLIVAGSTLLGYGLHNALGITGEELEARVAEMGATPQPFPPAPATAPPPRSAVVVTQPPPPPPAPAEPVHVPAPNDSQTAPPPPDVIDPGI